MHKSNNISIITYALLQLPWRNKTVGVGNELRNFSQMLDLSPIIGDYNFKMPLLRWKNEANMP